jgi:hypothetical protein
VALAFLRRSVASVVAGMNDFAKNLLLIRALGDDSRLGQVSRWRTLDMDVDMHRAYLAPALVESRCCQATIGHVLRFIIASVIILGNLAASSGRGARAATLAWFFTPKTLFAYVRWSWPGAVNPALTPAGGAILQIWCDRSYNSQVNYFVSRDSVLRGPGIG